ncbi:kinase-like protein, partial [Calocera cornea HHB12733]
IAREVSVWARLDNKNVLPFLGVRPQDDWESLWLVSPWMENGDIKTYLSANPNADRLSLASGVTSGVAYLHQNNIAHGDLKANNILVDSEGQPRLADFGLSLVLDDVLPEQTTSTMFAGSVRWMAPERIQPKRFGLEPSNSRTLPGDVFSLAMTLYEIFTLTLPYHELTQMDVPRAIVTGDRPPHPGPEAVQRGLHEDMWKFMQLCWSENPEHRPDLAKLSDDSDDQKSDSGETEEGDFRLSEIRSATVQTIERNIALDMPTNDPRPPVEASVGKRYPTEVCS